MRLAFVTAIALAGCVPAGGQPAEIVQLGPRPALPWSALRDAFDDCAHAQGLAGPLHFRIAIDEDGGAGSVSADRGGSDLARCVGQELGGMRFPRDHRGRAIEVPFVAHG